MHTGYKVGGIGQFTWNQMRGSVVWKQHNVSEGCLVRQGPQLLQSPNLPTFAVSCEDSTAPLKSHRTVHGYRVEAPGTHPGLAFSSHVPRDPWLLPISGDKMVKSRDVDPECLQVENMWSIWALSMCMAYSVSSPFHSCFLVPKVGGTWRLSEGNAASSKDWAFLGSIGSPCFFTQLSSWARPKHWTCASEIALSCLFYSLEYQGVCTLHTYMWDVQSPTPNPGPWSSMPTEKQVNRTRELLQTPVSTSTGMCTIEKSPGNHELCVYNGPTEVGKKTDKQPDIPTLYCDLWEKQRLEWIRWRHRDRSADRRCPHLA